MGFGNSPRLSGAHLPWLSIWLCVAFIVICVTFLAYLLNILALRSVHSSVVGVYIYLQPVIATIISISLGKDRITVEKVVSAALIFGGVYLVSFAGGRKVYAKPETEPDSDDMVLE